MSQPVWKRPGAEELIDWCSQNTQVFLVEATTATKNEEENILNDLIKWILLCFKKKRFKLVCGLLHLKTMLIKWLNSCFTQILGVE